MTRWAPRPLDAALAVLLTVAAQAELWATPLGPAGFRPLLSVSYAVATLAIACRRIAPLTSLAATIVGAFLVPGVLQVDPSAGLVWLTAVLLVIASAGYHARRPAVALGEAYALLALAIVLSKGPSLGDVVYAWLLSGAAWAAGRALATRTLAARLSEERAGLVEQEAAAVAAAAVAEERLRIARELHDIVSSGISGMALQVSGVRRMLGPDQARERAILEGVERAGRESLVEMQRMLGVLRGAEPETAVENGRLSSVGALLEPARAAGIRTELEVTGTVRPLPPGIDLAAYRIVQEAVTNVLKHARAGRLTCSVHYGPAAVELRVEDDGAGGVPPAGPGGHGHVGMRERAGMYGGSVETGRLPGGGYRVSAALPVGRAADAVREDAP